MKIIPRHLVAQAPRLLFAILTLVLLCGATPARAAGECSSPNFTTAPSFDIGNQVFTIAALAAADFNGDGRPDLAAVDGEAGFVYVLLNDGTGAFGAPRRFGVGGGPNDVAAADFNGDGKADLAVSNRTTNNVSILLGDGAGSFNGATNFAAGTEPRAFAVADFNNDGKQDIVLAVQSGQQAVVLLGDGNGSFAAAAPFAIGGQTFGLGVADFNADGKRDVAAPTSAGTFLLAGDGAGGFTSSTKVSAAGASDVAVADLNADGKPDLTLTVTFPTGLVTLLGDGAGGFGAPTASAVDHGGIGGPLLVTDLDGDAKPDAALASSAFMLVSVFKGDGAGAFAQTRNYSARTNLSALAAADFDGDAKPDLAAGGAASGGVPLSNVTILRNAGGGEFVAARATHTLAAGPTAFFPPSPQNFALADFNADGRADLAVVHRGNNPDSHRVAIMLGNASGGFTSAPSLSFFPGSFLGEAATGDFNGDGKADLAVAAQNQLANPSSSVTVFLGNGDGTFAAPTSFPVFASVPVSIVAADLNNDNALDFVTLNGNSANYTVLLGNGAGGFNFFAQLSVPVSFGDKLAIGEFNGDGKKDLVITDGIDRRVLVALGTGFGGFGAATPFNVGGSPSAAVVADLNGDGKQDLAVSAVNSLNAFDTFSDGVVSVLAGDGAGGFAAATDYRVLFSPQDIVAGDFDGDAKTDLAVVSSQGNSASVISNDGAGGFNAAVHFDLAATPSALAAADFNGDSRLDLAATQLGARTVAVLYNEPPVALPCLFADDLNVTEGNSGTTAANVNVRLSAASAQPVRVNYVVRGFGGVTGATEGQDFTPVTGTLVFQPGETAKTVGIEVNGDGVDELDEFFGLFLSGAVGARVSDGAAKVNISDDEQQPTISISDVTVTEGDSNSFPNFVTAAFTVTLSAPSSLVARADFATANGTATGGTDYDVFVGTVSFDPGTTSKTINVTVRGDLLREPDETFFVNLSNPFEATIADAQGQGTILDNDPVPALSVLNGAASEPASGDATANFLFRLSNPSSDTVTVDYATADDTATAGSDYVAASGTLTFSPGQVEKTVTVTVKGDDVDEAHETFFVNASNLANATAADGQGQGTIFDTDGPAVSVGDISVAEGQSGRTNATFTLSLSAPSPQNISVRVATANGTANGNVFPADFVAVGGLFAFVPAGASSATFNILVNGDLLVEPDETFFVNLSQPQDCTIADGQGQATITNDDGPGTLQFSAAAYAANEGDGSALITVTRAAGATGAVAVNYATSDGTATAGSDYTAASGTLSFAEGQTTRTFSVPLINDAAAEPVETVNLTLSDPTGGAALGAQTTAVLSIGNDLRPPLQFSAASFAAAESAGQAVVTVTRLGDPSVAVSVKYATTDGTASERRDYNLTLGTLRFAAGETEKTITVLVTDDRFAESPETFTVTLSDPSGGRLGQQPTTTVTITSDDAADGLSPVKGGSFNTEFFVRQHYRDFLNRDPDAGGLAFWVGGIESCGADQQCREVKRVDTSAAFFLSIEFQETGYLVYRAYKAAFGNVAGAPVNITLRQFLADTQEIGRGVEVGVGDWQAQLAANKRAFAEAFVGRAEFLDRYPLAQAPADFVAALDANTGMSLTAAERAQLADELAANNTPQGRAAVFKKVAENAEFSRRETNRAFVLMQYFGYLRRNPNDAPDADFAGYNFWLQKLNQFDGNFVNAEMVRAFIESIEYGDRFGR